MNKQISIIGCGWLGLPLAKELIKDTYIVKGSTTTTNKLSALKAVNIEPYIIEFTKDGINGDIKNCFSGSDILILNVPPGLRKQPETNFVNQIEYLIPYIENSSIQKLIFISSTSVYSDEVSIPIITEKSIPKPETESGKQLLIIENLLQNNKHFQTTIIRFSGLYGEDRHPAKSLSGKINLKNPEAPVNLIHLNDCIGIIKSVIKNNAWNNKFNASTTPHPSRKNYYTSVCNSLNLPVPKFDESMIDKGKIINSDKLVQLLNYSFKIKL